MLRAFNDNRSAEELQLRGVEPLAVRIDHAKTDARLEAGFRRLSEIVKAAKLRPEDIRPRWPE